LWDWLSILGEGSWHNLDGSTVGEVVVLMVSSNLHVTHVVGVSNGDESSEFVIKEDNVTLSGIAEVLDLMSSLE